jgi:hypothetical protein
MEFTTISFTENKFRELFDNIPPNDFGVEKLKFIKE